MHTLQGAVDATQRACATIAGESNHRRKGFEFSCLRRLWKKSTKWLGNFLLEEQQRLIERLNGDLRSVPTGEETQALTQQTSDGESYKKGQMPRWYIAALEVARAIEESGIELPSDLAEQHDHYIYGYGTPKR